jgi:hypothetical protein
VSLRLQVSDAEADGGLDHPAVAGTFAVQVVLDTDGEPPTPLRSLDDRDDSEPTVTAAAAE